MSGVLEWFKHHEALTWGLIAFSSLTFVATLILVPWWLTRMPADYFTGKNKPPDGPAALQLALRIGKNVLGYFFIVTGILMLVLPGQGLLTLVAGIVLVDFPRKKRLLRWIVARGPVLRFVNRRRERAGRAKLKV
jgi:hypothetical protein